MSEKPDFSAAIKDLATHQARWVRSHPDAEELMAYVAQELPEEQREVVEEHLARCRECRVLVRDFAEVLTEEEPSFEVDLDDEEVEAGLAAMKVEVAAAAEAESDGVPIERPRPVIPAPRTKPLIAATVLLAFASIWGLTQHRRAAMLSQPAVLETMATLYPLTTGVLRGTGAAGGEVTVGVEDGGQLSLALPESLADGTEVVLRLVKVPATEIWRSAPHHVPEPPKTLGLRLPADFLAEGSYEIHLMAVEAGTTYPPYPFKAIHSPARTAR